MKSSAIADVVGRLRQVIADQWGGVERRMAADMGVHQQTLNAWAAGRSAPGERWRPHFERVGVSYDYIRHGIGAPYPDGGRAEHKPPTAERSSVVSEQTAWYDLLVGVRGDGRRVPIAAAPASAGTGNLLGGGVESYLNLDAIFPDGSAIFPVVGKCMEPKISPGDEAIVTPYWIASPRDGDVVLALVSGEMVVKRYKSNGQQMLVPDAAGFETIPVTEDVKILGVIYRVMRKTR